MKILGVKCMQGFTIAKKIVLSFTVLILLFVGFGGYAIYSAKLMDKSTTDFMDWTKALSVAGQLSDAADEVRSLTVLRGIVTEADQRAEVSRRMAATEKEVEAIFADYEATLAQTTYYSEEERRADRELLDSEEKAWKAYMETIRQVDAIAREGNLKKTAAFLEGPARTSYLQFAQTLQNDKERAVKGTQAVQAESDATYRRVVMGTAVATAVAFLLTCICGYYLLHNIKTAVHMVLTSLEKVAAGDLRVVLPTDSGDEFAQMARQCNKMLDNVRAMTKTIQKTAGTVSDSSTTLTSTSGQSAQVTQNVAQSITAVAEAAQDQMASIAETKHQVEAFTNGLKEAIHHIASVAAGIAQTSDKAETGNGLVVSTVTQMNTIADTTASIAEAVAKLGERSKEIGNIVEVISGISAQTNLLALNAAIEAARAGEHGRGFAVVAEEVRKLAEGSQNATAQITELIQTIQQETEQAVSAMAGGRAEAEKGRENVASTGGEFAEILRMIQSVGKDSEVIRTTMADLERRAEKIDTATAKIHESAERVAAESENVSAATEEQAAGMEEIAASARSLSDMAEDLNQAAARFKT
ncbi:MAG: methyl-accepting chemotaxis protein [Schwartzia sp. (in: firmicutes)]